MSELHGDEHLVDGVKLTPSEVLAVVTAYYMGDEWTVHHKTPEAAFAAIYAYDPVGVDKLCNKVIELRSTHGN